MFRRYLLPALLVGTMALASPLMAEEEKCSKCPDAAQKKCSECPTTAQKECSACPITAAMKKLPTMTYAVGQETTCCEKSASKLAKDHNAAIVYLVGKDQFTDASEAKIALVAATEKFVDGFAQPHVCSVSGTTTIAGQKTECSKTAAKLTGLMANAMKNVRLTYAVGDKTCDCPHAATSLAKTSGKPKLFVVGEEKTECEVTARLNLARAKYRAMVEALVETEKETKTDQNES